MRHFDFQKRDEDDFVSSSSEPDGVLERSEFTFECIVVVGVEDGIVYSRAEVVI